MYSRIVNPITGRRVSITSRLGRQILRNYLTILSGVYFLTHKSLLMGNVFFPNVYSRAMSYDSVFSFPMILLMLFP